MTSKTESLDSSEQYYAHMESDRNAAEKSYFDARPQADTRAYRAVFCAGFERAFQLLWNDLQAARRETDRACQEYRELNHKYVQDMRAAHETNDGRPRDSQTGRLLCQNVATPYAPRAGCHCMACNEVRSSEKTGART